MVNLDADAATMNSKAHDVSIRAIDWSPDGQRLAIAADNGIVKVIEPRQGNELLTFRVASSVSQVAWSPSGKRLAAATAAGAIQVWDATRGYEFAAGGSRHAELAWAYYRQAEGRVGETADSALRKSLELAREALDYRVLRGNARARLGDFDAAAKEFGEAVPAQADLGMDFMMLQAYALLGTGDKAAFRSASATITATNRDSECIDDPLGAAYFATFIPDAVDGFKENVDLIKQRAADREADPNRDTAGTWDMRECGVMLYRLGQYEEAVSTLTNLSQQLDSALDQSGKFSSAYAEYFLAMTHQKLGNELQARKGLEKAIAMDESLQGDPSLNWCRRVVLNTLRREAKGVIDP